MEYPFDYCSKFAKIDSNTEHQIEKGEIEDPRVTITRILIENYMARIEKKTTQIKKQKKTKKIKEVHTNPINDSVEMAEGLPSNKKNPLESSEDLEESFYDEKPSLGVVSVFNHRAKVTHEVAFQHKVMYWSTYHGIKKFVKYFMEEKHVSPWRVAVDGESSMHCACKMHHLDLVEYFLSKSYQTIERTPISLEKVINIKTTKNLESPLHLACQNLSMKENEETIQNALIICDVLVRKAKINKDAFNFRGWGAWDITDHPSIKALEMKYKEEEIAEFEESLRDQNLSIESIYQKKYERFETAYQFCLVVRGLETMKEPGLVGKQLRNIQEDFQEKLKSSSLFQKGKKSEKRFFNFQAVPGFSEANNYTFYVISLDSHLVNYFADKLGLLAYNFKLDIVTEFLKDEFNNFEEIRDAQVQRITLDILKEEFDLNGFMKSGILLDYFPLHEFQERASIKKYWRKEKFSSALNMLMTKTDMNALLPICTIANYYGPYVNTINLAKWPQIP